jgi:branched-chain amino acid transport system permease protein
MIGVWAVELGLFVLVVAALLAERPVAVGLTVAAIGILLVVVRTSAQLWGWVAATFRIHRAAALAGAAVLALALPFFLRASPYWTFVATMALVYVTIGQGMNMQLGTAGAIGPLVAMVVGALLFIPILKVRGHYLALVTIAFGFIFNILMNNLEFTGGPQGIKNIPTLRLFGYAFTSAPTLFGMRLPSHANFYFAALAMAGLVTWLAWRLYNSWAGLTLNTLRDDEIAAKCSGVSVARYKLLAFSIGNFFIGLGGAFYAVMVGFVSPPDFDFGYSLVMVSVIILGGLDSIPGIVLGACLLIPLPERFRMLHEYRLLLYGAVIVLMLLFRPRGLWPATVRRYGLKGPAGSFGAAGGGSR